MIPRWAVPELGDQAWYPAWAREALTGFLQTMITHTRPYAPAVPRLAALLAATQTTHVVDLGSGAGGPWPGLQAELAARGVPVHVTCTDLAPNRRAAAAWPADAPVQYHPTPVSATAVPASLRGARTMFSALHHFTPAEVCTLLADAQTAGVAFAAFEATSRSGRGLLATLAIPFAVLALMPAVRPSHWGALVCTYCPPLLPLTIAWDGLASTLRTYRVVELEALIATLPPAAYVWEVVELPGGALPVLAVLGRPVAPHAV